MPRKRGRRVSHRRVRHSAIHTNTRIVFINLVVFVVLFLISLTLWSILQVSPTLQSLFLVFTIGFGAISAAFLITLVVFLFLKVLQKK